MHSPSRFRGIYQIHYSSLVVVVVGECITQGAAWTDISYNQRRRRRRPTLLYSLSLYTSSCAVFVPFDVPAINNPRRHHDAASHAASFYSQ